MIIGKQNQKIQDKDYMFSLMKEALELISQGKYRVNDQVESILSGYSEYDRMTRTQLLQRFAQDTLSGFSSTTA